MCWECRGRWCRRVQWLLSEFNISEPLCLWGPHGGPWHRRWSLVIQCSCSGCAKPWKPWGHSSSELTLSACPISGGHWLSFNLIPNTPGRVIYCLNSNFRKAGINDKQPTLCPSVAVIAHHGLSDEVSGLWVQIPQLKLPLELLANCYFTNMLYSFVGM